MIIHVATPELVVLEAKNEELSDENTAETIVRNALAAEELEQWSSIEIEDFTYLNKRLIFATPIRIYIPNFLARLLN